MHRDQGRAFAVRGRDVEVSDSALRILAGLLEARTGQQLTISRRWRIETALKDILRQNDITCLEQLITHLVTARDPGLADDVVEALLNNETYFFRDAKPFELLKDELLPHFRRARARERRIKIWCAGVSFGQEAYSIAMIIADQPLNWTGWTVDILGTDVSRSAIERAREGLYSQFEVQRGLPVDQMVRWFEPERGKWRLHSELARAVRFQAHSVLEPPPQLGAFDIILCRNVLLYFSAEMRRAAFARLSEAVASDGALILGAGETVIGQTDRFVPDVEARALYRASRPAALAAPAMPLYAHAQKAGRAGA